MQGIYQARFTKEVHPTWFRSHKKLSFSELGIGTARGEAKNIVDDKIARACGDAVSRGFSVIDTAPSFRHYRSEKAVGTALKKITAQGLREDITVMTRAGMITSTQPRKTGKEYIEETLLPAGVHQKAILGDYYSLDPTYLDFSLTRSLKHLNTGYIDLFFLENPELLSRHLNQDQFYRFLAPALEFLEAAVSAGTIRSYGVSSLTGLTAAADHPDFLSLKWLQQAARNVAGKDNHFAAVQFPYSLGGPAAIAEENQNVEGKPLALIPAATALGLAPLAIMPLGGGQLTLQLPDYVGEAFPQCTTAVQQAVQFVRSTPGILHTSIGMRSPYQLDEIEPLRRIPPASGDTWRSLFSE